MLSYDKTQKAAALRYSPDAPGSAPVVVASGLGYVAQKIIDVAQENDVPVYQDDSLASLLSQMQTGSEIPPELYQAVVDIYIYFLNFALEGQADGTKPALKGITPPTKEKNLTLEAESQEGD